MSKNKQKTATPEATQAVETTPASVPVTPVKKPESLVDEVFDTLTAWAAQGLGYATRGLEASARWLDSRAKVVGELATKLSGGAQQVGEGSGAQKA